MQVSNHREEAILTKLGIKLRRKQQKSLLNSFCGWRQYTALQSVKKEAHAKARHFLVKGKSRRSWKLWRGYVKQQQRKLLRMQHAVRFQLAQMLRACLRSWREVQSLTVTLIWCPAQKSRVSNLPARRQSSEIRLPLYRLGGSLTKHLLSTALGRKLGSKVCQ